MVFLPAHAHLPPQLNCDGYTYIYTYYVFGNYTSFLSQPLLLLSLPPHLCRNKETGGGRPPGWTLTHCSLVGLGRLDPLHYQTQKHRQHLPLC